MKRIITVFMMMGILVFGGFADAKIYRWVDENGVTRYTDTPPPGTVMETPDKTGPDPSRDAVDPIDQAISDIQVDMELSGEVLGSDGEYLSGVTMTLEEHHFPPGSYEYRTVRKDQAVDGKWSVSCKNCPIHSLRFRAPGYLSERYTLSAAKSEENTWLHRYIAIMSGNRDPEPGTPVTFRRSGIRIVLQPESSVVRLHLIECQFFTGEDGPFQALAGVPSKLKQLPFQSVEEEKTKAGVSPYAVLFLSYGNNYYPDLLAAGEKNTFHTLDTSMYMELTGVEGGFIPASPQAFKYRKKFDELSEAPKNGYEKRLEITPDQKDSLFFYCKIGHHFGKGELITPTFQRGRSTGYIRSFVTIYMNPEPGSRNLKSRL